MSSLTPELQALAAKASNELAGDLMRQIVQPIIDQRDEFRRQAEFFSTTEPYAHADVYYNMVKLLGVAEGGSVIEKMEQVLAAAKAAHHDLSRYARIMYGDPPAKSLEPLGEALEYTAHDPAKLARP